VPALDQAVAVNVLSALSGQASFTATTTPLKLRITMSAPTATVAGAEISGTGYTAGGSTITFGAPAGTATGALMLNSASLTWTNGGVAAWNVVGCEIYDSAGTPRRLAYGLIDDQPLVIGPGSPLAFAIASLGWAIP
jgi:hypothetical protein